MHGSQDACLAKRIAADVAERGGRVYYVGGYVRDELLDRKSKDIDVEVYGITPGKLREVLARHGEVLDKGASFGVLGLRHSDLDIAMPRLERRVGEGHCDFDVSVDPFMSTKEASMRRDFTINAMMKDVLTGEIVDHWGGRADLEKRIIRCVNARSFQEDALRAFRAAQFAARLEAQIDEATLALCARIDVTSVTHERVFEELSKALMKAQRPSIFFRELRRMGHLKEFFSEIEALIGVEQNPKYHPEGDVFEHTMLVLDAAAGLRERAEQPLPFMLAALMHDLGKIVATQVQADGRITAYGHEVQGLDLIQSQMNRLTNHAKMIAYVLNMSQLHMRPNMMAANRSHRKKTRALFDLSVCPNDLILLARADATGKLDEPYNEAWESFLREQLEDYRRVLQRPMVSGRDLVAAGLEPGEAFGRMLSRARQLHFSGIEKDKALKQVLSEYSKGEFA